MKRILFIYIGILIGVYLFLSILDFKGDYPVEKKLWHINKQFVQIQNDPSVVPEKTFERVAKQYRKIIKANPDSKAVESVYFLLGQLYEMKGDYPKAQDEYETVIQKYPDNEDLMVSALFQIARLHEIQGNETEAMSVYDRVIREYPLTEMGLSIPIYIANYYKSKNDYNNSMEAYQRAIRFYQEAASNNPDSIIEFTALRFLANCYLDQNRWNDAVATLSDVLMKYSTKNYFTRKRMELIVKTINLVSAYQIQDYQVAIDIYEKFMTKFPEHPYNKHLKEMIEVFHEAEGKNLKLSNQK